MLKSYILQKKNNLYFKSYNINEPIGRKIQTSAEIIDLVIFEIACWDQKVSMAWNSKIWEKSSNHFAAGNSVNLRSILLWFNQ